jgi:hypothetical protein
MAALMTALPGKFSAVFVYPLVRFQKEAFREMPQYIGGGNDLLKLAVTLYIKLTIGQTPKGEGEKNYLVCYWIWKRKETSCKEIE